MGTETDDKRERRYEREIREILERIPDFLPEGERPRATRRALHRFRFTLPRVSAKNLAVLAFLCLGISYVVRPLTPIVASYFGVATVALLVAALVVAISSSRATKYERRWRGRVMTLPSDTPEWRRWIEQRWWRLRTRWRRWRKK